MYKVSYEL